MPAWPLGVTYTKGLLGIDQRTTVAESLKQAAARAQRLDEAHRDRKLRQHSVRPEADDDRASDGSRRCSATIARPATAPTREAAKAFPISRQRPGSGAATPEALAETIRVGINSPHPESRASQMPAFGRDQILPRADIENVVSYVRTLSDPAASKGVPAEKLKAGKQSSRPIAPPVMATTLGAARRRARQTLPTSSGSMAAMRRPSPQRPGAAVRATCRLGKADCRRSTARFSRFMSSI